MKAVLFYEHGGPEVLRYEDFPTPEPGPEDVLIQVKAAALNRLDLFVRQGWPGLKLAYPHIPGADAAGVVVAVGERVQDVAPGDRVVVNPTLSCGHCEFCMRGEDQLCADFRLLGEHVRGSYAEYLAVPARNVVKVPDGFPFEEAAAAGLVYVTAWHSLVTLGHVRPGETVLVVGAGGGVNTAYIQIAKLAGATVYVVGSSAEKLERARALGADVLIDRSQEDWSRAVFLKTDKRGVDIVVDNVGQATWFGSIRALRKGGRMLVVGNTSGPKFDLDIRYIFAKHLNIIGSTMGSRSDFATVMGLVFAGKLRSIVDTVMPLSQARAAHERLASQEHFGKIVLVP
jgi:NADPH:quinone reductase-like Zn-dependent oxidoreductase